MSAGPWNVSNGISKVTWVTPGTERAVRLYFKKTRVQYKIVAVCRWVWGQALSLVFKSGTRQPRTGSQSLHRGLCLTLCQVKTWSLGTGQAKVPSPGFLISAPKSHAEHQE